MPFGSVNDAGQQVYTPAERRRRRVLASLSTLGCLGFLSWAFFRMLRGSSNLASGDFKHFYWASEAMRGGLDPYAAGLGGYIYPPLFAWLIQPLIPLGRVVSERCWGVVNMLLIITSLVFAFRIVRDRLRGHGDWLTWSAVLLMAMGLTFDPIRWEMEEGQTDTIMLLAITLGLWLLDRYPVAAGAVLALSTQIKHQAVLFLGYLVVRGRWRTSVGFVAAAPLIAIVPMTTMGPERWSHAMSRAYSYIFTVASGGASPEGVNLHPITWGLSVSVPSAIARAIETGGEVPMAAVASVVGVIALGVFGITWWMYGLRGAALFRGRGGATEREHPGLALIEWSGLVIAILVFSPQTMVRHSFILIPVHVLVAYLILVPKPGLNRWPLVIGTLIYQLGTRLPPGEERFDAALDAWRSVGGASWCMLCMWFGLVWTGLGAMRAPYPRPVPVDGSLQAADAEGAGLTSTNEAGSDAPSAVGAGST